jgi:DNA-binding transcriptional LysR family regulator
MTSQSFDLNLLTVLDALIAERNVTRASQQLSRSQPAVSNALRRLRETLNDNLLVRGPKGMQLTPRADALREPLRSTPRSPRASIASACRTGSRSQSYRH